MFTHIQEERSTKYYFKARHVFAIMGFFAICTHYIMRININVAIIAMVNNTADEFLAAANESSYECPNRAEVMPSKQVNVGNFCVSLLFIV